VAEQAVKVGDEHYPHPRNVPGPFYVENGCCTACGALAVQAPGLIAYDEQDHCFVRRQPQTAEDLYRMVRAAWAADLGCLRYGGDASDILRRLAEGGLAEQCDRSAPVDAQPLQRNYVSFRSGPDQSALNLIHSLREYLRRPSWSATLSLSSIDQSQDVVSFAYSWYQEWHPISIRSEPGVVDRWLLTHSPAWQLGAIAVSLTIDDWLRGDAQFSAIRWFTAADWEAGSDSWRATPL
jgi:hypothetical protein